MQELNSLKQKLAQLKQDRLRAEVAAATGKLAANGNFGKLGSIFSKLYSPDLLLAVTITGQLYLLCLIEQIVDAGGRVISANTDGIVIRGTPEVIKKIEALIACYGWLTNFEFEKTDYVRYAAKDCNNYYAVKPNGEVKIKGIYAPAGLMKNPTNEICSKAVAEYLSKGTPIEETIRNHKVFVDFTQARTVKGGGVQYEYFEDVDDWFEVEPGQWSYPGCKKANVKRKSRPNPRTVGRNPKRLGRVARWYYSTQPGLEINYVTSGNKVPKSEGGRECMILPDEFPSDLDIDRYIDEAKQILSDCGVFV